MATLDAGFCAESCAEVAALCVLLCASAFFSGTETALFVLTRVELRELSQGGSWAGKLVGRLMKRPERVLNTLLLGNMIVNVAFASISAMLLLRLQNERDLPAWVVAAGSLCPLAAVIFFGEVTPKMLAYSVAGRWAKLSAWPVFLLQQILRPAIWVMEFFIVKPATKIILPSGRTPETIRPEEMAAMMELSASRGNLDSDAGEMLREIVWLSQKKVRDVMVPRVDVIQFDVNDPPEELDAMFRKTHLRKIPVFDARKDHTLGAVRAREFLLRKGENSIRDFIRPVIYIPENANLTQALDTFRRTSKQMAIVVDEYGGTAGLVTLEDILEEIVGDIPDRHELPEKPVEKISDSQYLVSGELPVHDWPAAFGLKQFDKRISTVGGLVMLLLERLPLTGDSVVLGNLRLTVREMRNNRVETVLIDVGGRKGAVK
ncbi:MAG TPA: hemolysin family protein [Phycisphaerae bacterium]|nr:hemolysin family protein [Phycisphaerae bacterium]